MKRLVAMLLMFAALPVAADPPPSQNEILEAVRAGQLLPLSTIEKQVGGGLQGQIIKIELEKKHGRWIYEFKVLGTDGRRSEIYVDGFDGAILKVEDK